ncbi:hypothetical protein EU244_033965 [Rhodococcus qingshengii]|uniref:hypothetical protein n=1 Tax=Rhodococcus qingshengii TaxID=334542 RepID=UPI0010A6A3AB|nr:hypothetical protein [Rhodococcus qingshengii]THJ69467.1 hypothetical protein EU244_21130 [Rhodococcus qingshengii]THJ69511.1 hypothetical protein EU244_21375 [Rhodococcus qingshengii]
MTSPDPTRPYPDGMLDGLGGIAAWANKTRAEYEADILGKVVESTEKITEFRDGQLDINDRVDLLSPLQDYGSAYANTQAGIFNKGQVGFTNQIGPMQGCRLVSGRIVLDDRGLWDIRCQLWIDWTSLDGMVEWEIRVLRPDGSTFSFQRTRLNSKDIFSSTNITSVVVPDAGYQVQIFITEMAPGRGAIGGPGLNRLTVQHISRDTTTGDTGQG